MPKKRTRFTPLSVSVRGGRCCKWAAPPVTESGTVPTTHLSSIIQEQTRETERKKASQLSVPVRRAQPLQQIIRQEIVGNRIKERMAYHAKQRAEAQERKEEGARRRELTENLRRAALEATEKELLPSCRMNKSKRRPQEIRLGDFIPTEVAVRDRGYDVDTWALGARKAEKHPVPVPRSAAPKSSTVRP